MFLLLNTHHRLSFLEFLINSLKGWTRFSSIPDLNSTLTSDWDTCFAVNVKAQQYLLRTALPTFNSNGEGGVFLVTSSIAGIGTSGSSLPYCVTKAAQLQWMRCMAAAQGPKVRVNAVLPGLLLTEWVSEEVLSLGGEMECCWVEKSVCR